MSFEFKIDEEAMPPSAPPTWNGGPQPSPAPAETSNAPDSPSRQRGPASQPVYSPPTGAPTVQVWLLVLAAVLAMTGLLMVIVPLAGSANLRGILVALFLVAGASMIALAAWLARHPERSLTDLGGSLRRSHDHQRASRKRKAPPRGAETGAPWPPPPDPQP